MGSLTSISWTDHTFNPWIGCTKVGPACDGCYADAMMGQDGRFKRATWGGPGQRSVLSKTGASNWKLPLKWNREAGVAIEHWRTNPFARSEFPKPSRFVFCASLADVFDKDAPVEWRSELFDLIRATPNLTWLLLTKRPQMIVKLFAEAVDFRRGAGPTLAEAWPRNAAVGATMVTQAEFDRDGGHLAIAKAALRPAFTFASVEPMLGAINMGEEISWLDWVITGGETDQGEHKARPAHPIWFQSLRDQCASAGVAYHHKQNGEWQPFPPGTPPDQRLYMRLDREGGVTVAWPNGHIGGGTAAGCGGIGTLLLKTGVVCAGREIDGVIHDARPAAPALHRQGAA